MNSKKYNPIVVGDGMICSHVVSNYLHRHDIIPYNFTNNLGQIDNTFVINGNRYAPIEHKSRYNIDLNLDFDRKYVRKLSESVDIKKEYEKILNKCSNLSKWERNEVVKIFEQKYYLITNN